MLNLRVSLASTVVLTALVALLGGCPPAETGEGEGEGEGEGTEGEGEAGEGEGEGEAPPPEGFCNTTDDCEADEVCASLFNGDVKTSCFKTCAAGACTTTLGVAGECAQINDFNATQVGACLQQSGLLEVCGNAVNASCTDDVPFCLQDPTTEIGVCAALCDPNGDGSTCTAVAAGPGCGCTGDLECSADFLRLAGATPQTLGDGVCANATQVGDACGINNDGSRTVCTGGQTCGGFDERGGDFSGNCEGGAAEGEGEGEGE